MPNILRASFHNRAGLRGLERVEIRQAFGKHTLAFLDYRIRDRREYLLPPENTPVAVSWGTSPVGVRGYYGYINHYETVTDEHQRALTRMVLLGTSKTMNSMTTGSWLGTTRSAIARDFARKHRLRSVIHDHPYEVEHWATGTRTDFQSLKALAEESGYRLWVDGATLHFLDPTKILLDASSMSLPTLTQRQIQHAKVMGGSNIPGAIEASSRRVQFGLDYRTNEFFEATSGNPLHPTVVSGAPVNTYSEAQEISDAAERMQRDYFVLQATVDGNSDLYPGALVRVDSGRVNSDQAGLWLVSEATHELTNSDFTTSIVATRGVDQRPLSRTPSTVRGSTGLSQAVVRDGATWEAALQEHVHV